MLRLLINLLGAPSHSDLLSTRHHRASSFALALICSLTFATSSGCETSPQGELSAEERDLYEWIKTRADLVRRHKSDCRAMARALVEGHARRAVRVREWRSKALGVKLSEHLLRRPLERRELTFVLEHTSELYAHCAHQRSFRTYLEELWTQSE